MFFVSLVALITANVIVYGLLRVIKVVHFSLKNKAILEFCFYLNYPKKQQI